MRSCGQLLECRDKIFYYRDKPVFGTAETQRLVFAKCKNESITGVNAIEWFSDQITQKIYDEYFVVLAVFESGWIANSVGLCNLSYDEYYKAMKKHYMQNGEYDKFLEYVSTPTYVENNMISRKWVEFCKNNGL